jgi:hypothetical protein
MTDRTSRAVWMSERFWRKNRLAHAFALLSVVALAATGTFAVEEAANLHGLGLSGIFPSTPPADLSEDEFAKLDGNWAEWSKGAAATVADFYSKLEGSDAAAQRRALGTLKIKQDVMRRALNDSSYRSLYGPLTALNNSLKLRIDFAEAVLDTLEIDGGRIAAGKTKSRASSLLSSIQSLENQLNSIGNGYLWMPYFKVPELRNALMSDPDGPTAIGAALTTESLLNSRDTVLDESQKTFTHRAAFENFSNALEQYLAAAAWKNPAEATSKLRAEIKELASALDTYAATGSKAKELRDAFSDVRFISADGGDRLASALQSRLFNYNLRVLVTEAFLNRIMSDSRSVQGPVNDFILGAQVNGSQITNTTVNVDLLPSSTTARFALRLNGNIRSNTQGVTPQATVYTAGNHTFAAAKEVNFDGYRFMTSPATISVNPHNTTTGIATQLSGIPILGRIAHNIASQAVAEKKGQSESIAASRVQDGVLPPFNREVDSSFATAGEKLDRELFTGLRATGLFPDTFTYQTSDQLMTVNARLMSSHQIGADLPESRLMAVTGATALLHETALNNAIDKIGIAGQTVTEPELRAKIEAFLSKALNRPFKFSGPSSAEPANGSDDEKALNAIIFANEDPIRIRIANDELTIVIRAGFKQDGKDDIPMREITVPISLQVNGRQIMAKAGQVLVSAADGEGGGVATNAVVRKKIQSVLPDRIVDGKVELKTPSKTVVTYVTTLSLVDGWIAVGID